MPDDVMETYIRQSIEARSGRRLTIAWQGGEPTLMGLDFFRRSIEAEKRCWGPGVQIENTVQTNGLLIDPDWCRFFHDNNFLVGLSLDGPRELHDAYRRDKNGRSVFERVVQAARLMQDYEVEFNILCTVNAANSLYPLDVYRFFRDELEAHYIQFIPIVEICDDDGSDEQAQVTDSSVDPMQYRTVSHQDIRRMGQAGRRQYLSCRYSTGCWRHGFAVCLHCASYARLAATTLYWSTTAISIPAITS